MARPSIPELLQELRSTEESTRIEAKTGFGKSSLETIVAFSNEPRLGGGFLLFGVAEDVNAPGGYKVVGVESPSTMGESITSECAGKLSVAVRPQLFSDTIEGVRVLAAFVAEAGNHDKPVFIRAKGVEHGCFRRIGSADVKCLP
jgi:ATP-dependent DNA helicase RecG